MGALIALIAVGFGMTTLGVALLCLGEVPFIAGKRIPARRARLIGATLALFLPLSLGGRLAINLLFGPDTVDGQVVTWSLFGLCWCVVFVILFRVMVPKRERRKPAKGAATPSKKNPFDAAPADHFDVPEKVVIEDAAPAPAKKSAAKKREPGPAPTKKPAGKKARKPAAENENPFDFS